MFETFTPEFTFPIPEEKLSCSCGDEGILFIQEEKKIEYISFSGESNIKTFQIQPNIATQLSDSHNWLIGFTNGTLSKYDSNFNLISSFISLGKYKAHSESILYAFERFLIESNFIEYVSIGADHFIKIWNGQFQIKHESKYIGQISQACCSQHFLFLFFFFKTNSKP